MNMLWIGIGALMLFGSFAAINSNSTSTLDHDFALILLIAGVITLASGFGFISLDTFKTLLP